MFETVLVANRGEIARRIIARYPDTFRLATTVAEIRAAHRAGRIASMRAMPSRMAFEVPPFSWMV